MAREIPALIVATLLLAGSAVAQENPLDERDGFAPLVLHNGRVFTADAERPWAEAISIRGEHILAVGDDDSVLVMAGPLCRFSLPGIPQHTKGQKIGYSVDTMLL